MDAIAAPRFEVLGALGKDSLGEILRARDTRDGCVVAWKRFRAQGVSANARERFAEEFAALALVRHPNVVRALEWGTDAGTGQPWYTMELVEGEGLHTWIPVNRPVDGQPGWEAYERRVCKIMRHVADALAAIHLTGLLHGALTPDCVHVLSEAPLAVKLIGLGRARRATHSRRQTSTLRGADSYVTPEHALGRPLTHAADLYGAGCLLFESLTGRPPFTGESVIEVLMGHAERPAPDPRTFEPRIRAITSQLCLALLEKQPSMRPRSAEALELSFAKLS